MPLDRAAEFPPELFEPVPALGQLDDAQDHHPQDEGDHHEQPDFRQRDRRAIPLHLALDRLEPDVVGVLDVGQHRIGAQPIDKLAELLLGPSRLRSQEVLLLLSRRNRPAGAQHTVGRPKGQEQQDPRRDAQQRVDHDGHVPHGQRFAGRQRQPIHAEDVPDEQKRVGREQQGGGAVRAAAALLLALK